MEVKGQRYLLENRCPHAGHPLTESSLEGENIRCPLHGICFSLCDGNAINGSGVAGKMQLTFYPLIYRDNIVGVDL